MLKNSHHNQTLKGQQYLIIAIHMQKTEIYFNKPIYVGQAILDLSKTFMFDFPYNYIKPNI